MRIHHLALRVFDPEAAVAFYSDLLGLPVLRRFMEGGRVRSIWLQAQGWVLMLERTLRPEGAETGSAHVLAFAVDDLAAWEARLAAARVSIADRTPYTLYIRDPDGHRVALSVHPSS